MERNVNENNTTAAEALNPMKTKSQDQTLLAKSSQRASRAFNLLHVTNMSNALRGMALRLACHPCGRIALHVIVALKTGHYLWHWHGIARELTRQHNTTFLT